MKVEHLLFIITFSELAAALVATYFYRKYKDSNEKYFLHFLWYTVIVDVVAISIGYLWLIENFWVYNGFMISMYLFYFYWYFSIIESPVFKKVIYVFVTLFISVAILSLSYQKWTILYKYTFITGAFFVAILTVFHFHQLLNSNQVLVVKHKLSFWISTGLLLFSIGMIPLFFLSEYLNFKGISYVLTLVSLNVILYGCYIIGFLWTKKNYNHF